MGERVLLRQVLAGCRAPGITVLAGAPTSGPQHPDCAGTGEGGAGAQRPTRGSISIKLHTIRADGQQMITFNIYLQHFHGFSHALILDSWVVLFSLVDTTCTSLINEPRLVVP